MLLIITPTTRISLSGSCQVNEDRVFLMGFHLLLECRDILPSGVEPRFGDPHVGRGSTPRPQISTLAL